MFAQAQADEPPSDGDLEALDKFLMSDRAPPDSMLLSDLDGFLTGIAVGPEPVPPSEWLPLVWGGEVPAFTDPHEAEAIVGTIMCRHNQILRQIDEGTFAPLLWVDRDGAFIAMDWAEGFLQAIMLRADAWGPLFMSEPDGDLLFPILSICDDDDGDSLLGLPADEKDRVAEQAPDLIPGCVVEIAAYWRRRGPRQTSMDLAVRPDQQKHATKVGRNDPCPCGSGKKFKRCCGQSG